MCHPVSFCVPAALPFASLSLKHCLSLYVMCVDVTSKYLNPVCDSWAGRLHTLGANTCLPSPSNFLHRRKLENFDTHCLVHGRLKPSPKEEPSLLYVSFQVEKGARAGWRKEHEKQNHLTIRFPLREGERGERGRRKHREAGGTGGTLKPDFIPGSVTFLLLLPGALGRRAASSLPSASW